MNKFVIYMHVQRLHSLYIKTPPDYSTAVLPQASMVNDKSQ